VVGDLKVYFPGEEEERAAFRFRQRTPLPFAKGKVYVLFGPNGKGKSTFLKGLSGYYPSTARLLIVNGRRIDAAEKPDWQERRQHFGHVFDDTEKSLPIAEKIGDFVQPIYEKWQNKGADLDAFLRFVIGMLSSHGIDSKEALYSRHPMTLSGGMRQILVYVIGRYLVQTPVMLMDEPFSRVHGQWEHDLIEDLFQDVETNPERTYLLITHRGDTLLKRGAQRIDLEQLEPTVMGSPS
jgi:ABC-type molybdenum transport system ATPase subunit/photorepair protein PhrA